MKKFVLAAVTLAAGFCTSACAQQVSVPVINAPYAAVAPRIDGVPDDECWKSAAHFSGFIHTALGTPAIEPTEMWLCRDAGNLYVAFYCHDSQPQAIRATQKRRNGDQGYDDRITINIDTQHDHQTQYYFKVNALGTQTEVIPSGSASNITWRGDWFAASKIVSDGWTTEIAIPFDLLRYPGKCDTFGFAVTRTNMRVNENTSWPDISPNYSTAKYADLTGLALPGIARKPILMPYTVSSREPGSNFDTMGLDFKQELSSNAIATFTYNPDFSNVQDAVSSIDYSYTERLLGEYRPFFQEGSALFPDSTAFYSRRVNDVDWGAKAFGDSGNSSFAVLGTLKHSQESHFASAYAYKTHRGTETAGAKFYLTRSTLASSFRQDGESPYESLCFSPGGFIHREDKKGETDISFRRYTAYNSGRPSSSSMSFLIDRSPASGNFGAELGYDAVDADFYVRDGYTSTKGIRGPRGKIEYYKQYKTGRISDWSTNVQGSRYWGTDDSVHHDSASARIGMSTRDEWTMSTTFKEGSWLGKRDATRQLTIGWLQQHLYSMGQLSLISGKRSGRDYKYMSCSQAFEVSDRVTLNGSFEWSRLGSGADLEKNTQFTLSSNFDLDKDRSLGLWVVGRGSKLNICGTFRKASRSGSDVYLIYGYPNSVSTEKRIAMKLVLPMVW